MEKQAIRTMAHSKLKEWGLWEKGWRFRWSRRKRAMGTCHFPVRVIEVSAHFAPYMDEAETLDVVLHEIAHALDYEDRGRSDHGPRWKRWARKVGANPRHCGRLKQSPPSRYTIRCSNCGAESPRHRRPKPDYPKRYRCGNRTCGSGTLTIIRNF